MRRRQVLHHRGEAALVGAAGVRCHPLAAMQQLHPASRQPRLQHLADQGLRHAVAVAIDLHVLVDVHPHRLVAGVLPGLGRQRLQRRRVQLGKRIRAAAGQLLERLGIELRQQRLDGVVDVVHALEAVVTNPHQNPARSTTCTADSTLAFS